MWKQPTVRSVRGDIPTPPLGPGQALIRVSAAGINPLDTKIRAEAADHARQPLPAVLGMDMAGTVEAVSPDVTAFRPGDEAFGSVGGVGGLQGTLPELIVADANLLAHKPERLTMRQSAALPLVTITAWEGWVDHAGVRASQTVLVHAGVGGVGNAAVQIAVAHGAKTFATVSKDKRSAVEAVGAIAIGRDMPPEEYVANHTGDEGFDVVFDTLGGTVLDLLFIAVKRYTGRVVSILGWASHSLAPLSFRAATYSGVFTLLPLLTGRHRAHHGCMVRSVAELVQQNRFQPQLAERHFGTDEIGDAFDAVAKGSRGKIVVEF